MIKIGGEAVMRYVHGSEDSTDIDVIYVFDYMPRFAQCKNLCDGKGNENGNIIVVRDGIVVFAYKGSVDEVNNALLRTYPLHKQEYPLIIERPVQRDILLKDIKVIRKILSSLSRTQYRMDIKAALRGNWGEKLKTLKGIDYHSIDFSNIPKTTKTNLYKSFAFQIGQALALHEGKELYTKREIADYFPELERCLQRKEETSDVIIKYIYRFIELLEGLPVEAIDENVVCFGKPFNARYNVNQEKRIGGEDGT